MRLATFFLFVNLALSGCGRQASRPSSPPVPPLPVVNLADVPAPAAATVLVAPGSNLRTIAETAYQHERFSGFVARLNGLRNPEQVVAGATLKTPSLPFAFRDAGLDPDFQPAINALAKAWTDFNAMLPAYKAARTAGRNGSDRFAIPANYQTTLTGCADAIDAANHVLSHVSSPHKAPRMAIEQFAKASAELRALATGLISEYDTEMVGQRFGLGFTNALVWAQEGQR